MKKKLLLTFMLVLCIGGTTAVSAATVTSAGEQTVPVEFSKDSVFTVTLPENISANSGNTTVAFSYSASGEIASNEVIDVSVVDADDKTAGVQIEMQDARANKKYATATLNTASITPADVAAAKVHAGRVDFAGLSAGTWTGDAIFKINLNTASI